MEIKLNQLDIDKYVYDNQPTIYTLLHKYYNHDQSKNKIVAYRMFLNEQIENLKDGELLKLAGDEDLIRSILFDFDINSPHNIKFGKGIHLEKIDFSNISFSGLKVRGLDFSALHGVKINPQTIYDKNLDETICKGVTFTGPFTGVSVIKTNFTGSINVNINPQTLKDRTVKNAILKDVTFIGWFGDVEIIGADFTGSKNAMIDPQDLKESDALEMLLFSYKSMENCILKDVQFIGTFDDIFIEGADFTGSKNAKIDPRKLYSNPTTVNYQYPSVRGCKLCDVEFTGPFEEVIIKSADFTGSINADIDPQKLPKSKVTTSNFEKCASISECKFNGVNFKKYSFKGISVKKADFTGSKNVRINPQTIYDKDLSETICNGVTFIMETMNLIDLFRGVKVIYTDFTNSIGAELNPQTIWLKSLVGTICNSVKFIGPFDEVRISKTDFRGSKNAKINPQTIYKGVIDDSILIDAEIIEPMEGMRVTGGIDFIYNPKNQSEKKKEESIIQKIKKKNKYKDALLKKRNEKK